MPDDIKNPAPAPVVKKTPPKEVKPRWLKPNAAGQMLVEDTEGALYLLPHWDNQVSYPPELLATYLAPSLLDIIELAELHPIDLAKLFLLEGVVSVDTLNEKAVKAVAQKVFAQIYALSE